MRGLLIYAACLACLAFAVTLAVLPGPHRALVPQAFGAHKITPGIYTDAPEHAAQLRALVTQADADVAAFMGELRTNPRIIVCTQQGCADRFRFGSAGLNIWAHLIFIGPDGLGQITLTHERMHAELHRGYGLDHFWSPDFPLWFDEGLAALVSADTRLPITRPQSAAWIKHAHTMHDWADLAEGKPWVISYGAALSLVADFAAHHGRAGLRDLIARVEAGEAFQTVWAQYQGTRVQTGLNTHTRP